MTDTKRLLVLIIVALWCLCSLPFAHAQNTIELSPINLYSEPKCGEPIQTASTTIVIKKKGASVPAGGGDGPNIWVWSFGLGDSDFQDAYTDSGWTPSAYYYGAAITVPAGGGTVTQLAMYGSASGGTPTLKIYLYNSSGTPVVGGTVAAGVAEAVWNIVTGLSQVVAAGTYYVIGSSSDNTMRWGYDTANDGKSGSGAYADMPLGSGVPTTTETSYGFGVKAYLD